MKITDEKRIERLEKTGLENKIKLHYSVWLSAGIVGGPIKIEIQI